MALGDYKSSLSRYRRYLASLQERPVFRASLSIVLSLVLVIVLVLAALRPTLVTIAGLLNEIKQKKELVVRLDQKISQVTAAQAAYQAVLPRLGLLDEALPKQAELKGWINSLEKVATDSGVKVGLITIGPVPAGKIPTGLTEIGFSLSTDSDYRLARQFVEQLEKLKRLVKIGSVQVSKTGKDQGGVGLTITGVIGEMYEEKTN